MLTGVLTDNEPLHDSRGLARTPRSARRDRRRSPSTASSRAPRSARTRRSEALLTSRAGAWRSKTRSSSTSGCQGAGHRSPDAGSLIHARGFRNHGIPEQIARAVSVALALIGLAVLAPLLALIALAIKLIWMGPVLFVQERIGRGGRPFNLLKFERCIRGERRSEWVQDNPIASRESANGFGTSASTSPARSSTSCGEMNLVAAASARDLQSGDLHGANRTYGLRSSRPARRRAGRRCATATPTTSTKKPKKCVRPLLHQEPFAVPRPRHPDQDRRHRAARGTAPPPCSGRFAAGSPFQPVPSRQ